MKTPTEPQNDYIIQAEHVTKKFTLDAGFFAKNDRFVYAVNDVSFGIERGKTYGLVGESGCGKTTTARMVVRMYRADSGKVWYRPSNGSGEERALPPTGGGRAVRGSAIAPFGADESSVPNGTSLPRGSLAAAPIPSAAGSPEDVFAYSRRALRRYREKIKYVFQDPSRSLNPRMNVFNILTASYRYASIWPGKKQAYEEAARIMEEVGLDARDLERHPGEFSGGQRQRISIARALIMRPEVIFCDEVVSALDVSVQSQILNLLQDIRETRGLSFLFIAHDLRVSCYFCDTIGVMYRGLLVEEAPAAMLYKEAVHPYTRLLFSDTSPSEKTHASSSEVTSVLETLSGCPFSHRCPHVSERCRREIPEWKEVGSGHKVRCWLL